MEEKNYTPLDISKFEQATNKQSKLNTVLLVIATLTAAVFSALLLILIQREMKKRANNQVDKNIVPTAVQKRISPTQPPTVVISPTLPLSPSPSSSESSSLISPTSGENGATQSSNLVTPTPSPGEENGNSSGSAQVEGE